MGSSGPQYIGHFVDWMANMPSWVVWLLLAIALVMLLFVIISIPKLRRLLPSPPLKAGKKEDEDTGMVRACRQFHANLRATFPGGRSQYRLPLYIAIGPSTAATQTCIRDSGLVMPLGQPLSSGGLTWSAFDRGSVVEVGPSVYEQVSRWRTFIRLLQRFRPHRPLDGIIVVIPADEFDPETPNFEKSLREAENIRKALAELGNKIVMAVPIYCVIAQCENISGFDALGKVIGHNSLSRPLGFTSPHGAAQIYHPEFVEEALTSIADRIQNLVMHALTIDSKDLDRDPFFGLPKGFKNLIPKLQNYLNVLMEPGQFSQLSSLRGIYVNGILNTGENGSSDFSAFAQGALKEKIFPEFGIATPTINYWSSANRNVRKAQISVIVLFVLGVFGLLAEFNIMESTIPRISQAIAAVSKDYRHVSAAQARPGALKELFSEQAGPIIQRLSGIKGSSLRSALVPNSYYGGLVGDLDTLRTEAFVEILLKNIGRSLKVKAVEVTRESSGTRLLIDTGFVDRAYPNYQLLQDLVSKFSTLITHIDHYERLLRGNKDHLALNALTDYLYGVQLHSTNFPNINLDHVESNKFVFRDLNTANFSNQAQVTMLREGEKFYSDIENRGNLIGKLTSIAHALSGLQVSYDLNLGHAIELSSQGRIQNLFDNLLFLDAELGSRKYDWIINDETIVSEDFQDILFQIENNKLLGPKVAGKLRKKAISVRRNLQESVLRVRVAKLGTLVQAVDGRLSLSPVARKITKELEASGKVVNLGINKPIFIDTARAEYNQHPLPKPISGNFFIKWDLTELRYGSQKLSKLLKTNSINAATPGLLAVLKNLDASERINLILQTLNSAFRLEPIKFSLVAGSSGSSLADWSYNFHGSLDILQNFISVLDEPAAKKIKSDLINLITGESVRLISHARDSFNSKGFYSFDKKVLDEWDGTTAIANRLFGGRNKLMLLATLDQKRLQIRSIANSHVEAPLNFLLKYSQVLKSDVIEDIIFWRVILEDLVAYKNQIPNNNIQKLEQFLSVNLQSMSVGDCKTVSNSGPPGDASYFLQKLQEISIATVGGCKRIENAEVQIAYNKFASRFNKQFVGRGPFSIDPKSNSAGPVLDPRSLVRLFRDFDDSMNRGMGDPSYWPAGEKTTNIIGFLNKFDEAVSTIRPGIIGDPNNAKMVYEVTPTFRVLRDREAGGDQIIDWSMTVGDQSVRFTDQKRMLVWETGKPIKFKFRWAKNSESVPVSDDKNNNQFSSGKDLTLVFDGSWSLFTLLRKNGKLNTEASAYNLQFNIPIAKKSEDDKTTSEPYGVAKIFVALKLTVNGETIKLPRFPGRAPTASF